MITLTAKINLLSGETKSLEASENVLGNNISSSLGDILNTKKKVSNPFIIGASTLGDGSTFSSGVNYFIGKTLSDENGSFEWEMTSSYGFSISEECVDYRRGGVVEIGGKEKYSFFLSGIFQTENVFKSGDKISFDTISIVSNSGKEIAKYPSSENDIFSLAPVEPHSNFAGILEGFQVIFYVDMETADGNALDEIIGSTIYFSGSYERKQKSERYDLLITSDDVFSVFSIDFDSINKRHPNNILIDAPFKLMSKGKDFRVDKNNRDVVYYEIFIKTKMEDFVPFELDLQSLDKYSFLYGEINTYPWEYDTINKGYKTAVSFYEDKSINYPTAIDVTVGFTDREAVSIADDDPTFFSGGLKSSYIHSISINNWNTPNSPFIVTGIYAGIEIEIDRRNMISINSNIFDRSDLKLPSFGIISNTGNIEFIDVDGEVRDSAEQLLLGSGSQCEIFLNNTLVEGASERVGLFETDEWDYDNDNRVVSVSLKDDLQEWQDINVSEISYDPRKPEHKPFKWLYEHLWAITTANNNYNMIAFDKLDTDTQGILQNTYTQYPLLESCSLWTAWEKLCEVCKLHIYKDKDGVVVCRYNGGN